MMYTVVVGVSKAEPCLLAGQISGLVAWDWSAVVSRTTAFCQVPWYGRAVKNQVNKVVCWFQQLSTGIITNEVGRSNYLMVWQSQEKGKCGRRKALALLR